MSQYGQGQGQYGGPGEEEYESADAASSHGSGRHQGVHQQQPSYGDAPQGLPPGGAHPEYAQGYPESTQGYPESAQGYPESAHGYPESAQGGYPESAHGYPESAAGGYPESAYEPSPHGSHPSAQGTGSGRMASPYSSGQAAPSPYGMDPSTYGGSPQGGPAGGPGYAGGSYGGSPPGGGQGVAPGGYGQEYGQGYGQDPMGGSQQPGVTFDGQSMGEEPYEEEVAPGSDGRPHSQGSGQLYHSAEFPLGANPNAGESDRGSQGPWESQTEDTYSEGGDGLHQRPMSRQGSQRSRGGSYRQNSYRGSNRDERRSQGTSYDDEEEYYDDDEEYRRNNTYKRTGTFSRTLTFFGRTLTRTNTMSKNLSRTLTRTITRQYKFDTEEEVEEAAAAMEEARRRRLERGDDPLEDATTKVVAGTAKLARTMTMAVTAPVAKILEDEQVQKHMAFFKERAMTMAMGKPDWHPEPPRVPLPAACNCCSIFILLLCAFIPILLVIPLTRSVTMQPFVPLVAEPVGPPMPDTTLPPLGAVCTSGGYGAPVVPQGVRSMDSTWASNALADGAQIQIQTKVGNLWWSAAPPKGARSEAVNQPDTYETPPSPEPPSPPYVAQPVAPLSPGVPTPPPASPDMLPPPGTQPPSPPPTAELPPPPPAVTPAYASPPPLVAAPGAQPPPEVLPPTEAQPPPLNQAVPPAGETPPAVEGPMTAGPMGVRHHAPPRRPGIPGAAAPDQYGAQPPIPDNIPPCPVPNPKLRCPKNVPYLPHVPAPPQCWATVYDQPGPSASNFTANIYEAYGSNGRRMVPGAFKPQDDRIVYCPNATLFLRNGEVLVPLEDTTSCRPPADFNITINKGTFFQQGPDGKSTAFYISGLLVKVEPYVVFYNVTVGWGGVSHDSLTDPCVYRGRVLRDTHALHAALRAEHEGGSEGSPVDGHASGAAHVAGADGEAMLDLLSVSGFPYDPLPGTTASSGAARSMLGAAAPGPAYRGFGTGAANNRTRRANATAGAANTNSSGSAFANWANGPIGLHTNTPPPATEFMTVQRVDIAHFYLLAPNQKYLVLNANGSLTASAPSRTLATLFNVTLVGEDSVVLGTGDGRVLGWGSSPQNQCDGANNPLAAAPGTSFQQDYGCRYSRFNESDYHTWRIREVTKVPKIRGMNLGGWLVLEEWMTPQLYNGVPDMIDGWNIQLQASNSDWLSANNPRTIYANIPSPGDMETWAVQRANGASTQQIRLRIVKGPFAGQFLTAGEPQSNGALYLGDAAPDTVNNPPRDVFNFTLGSGSTSMMLQAYNGKFLTVGQNGMVVATATQPPDFSGPCVFLVNRVSAVQGEYQISGFAPNAVNTVQSHRQNFIQESDWAHMAAVGVNTVRIPIGWWIAQGAYPDAPFIPGADAILDNAFVMAEKYNIRIWISIHACPGGQNPGAESASRDGVIDWDREPFRQKNRELTLNTTEWVAARYSKSPAFFGIGLMNEPNAAGVSLASLMEYYELGYALVRRYSPCAYVGFMPRIGADISEFRDFMTDPIRYHNTVIEVHYYNVYDPKINTDPSVSDQVNYIVNNRLHEIRSLERGSRTVIVGEWSLALPDLCGASRGDYKTFSQVQLYTFNLASGGWFFWSYKVDPDSTGVPNWSLDTATAKGWLMYY